MGSGCRSATGPISTMNSLMSRAFFASASARSAHSGSSRSWWPYSLTFEPQPAALRMT
jgi:hypothetical protein